MLLECIIGEALQILQVFVKCFRGRWWKHAVSCFLERKQHRLWGQDLISLDEVKYVLTPHREQDALIIASTSISFGGKLRKRQIWKEKSTSFPFILSIANKTAWFWTWGSVGCAGNRSSWLCFSLYVLTACVFRSADFASFYSRDVNGLVI